MSNEIPVEQFWDAVVRRDYETVRKAIAAGFDVNARIPGKVAPITFAQPAEDMLMLKMLWEAGAQPATPWLQMVFADFASGGDGSAFKRKKTEAVGRLILHRYNGDEVFEIGEAVIQAEKDGGQSRLILEISSNGKAIKSLPDTVDLRARPSAQISILIANLDAKKLVGKKISLPNSYDENTGDYSSTICYVEHEPVESNEVEFLSRKKNKILVKWSGETQDVNYYDGSKPNAHIEIEGWFTLR